MNAQIGPHSTAGWTTGNRFELLENGEQYFPAITAAIAGAKKEVLIETFILFDDSVGRELQKNLIDAADRGVRVELTVDDYGSPDLPPTLVDPMTAAGVRIRIYDPRPRFLGLRVNLFRRLHRKIVAVDGESAFVGGINFGADHLRSHGETAKQDYAVCVRGPLARHIQHFVQEQIAKHHDRSRREFRWLRLHRTSFMTPGKSAGDGEALFVFRDNDQHRDDIERHYRIAIAGARSRVTIASAYFFPGHGLLRQLMQAARRGVTVQLILQGAPDVPQAKTWAMLLYPALLNAGVEVHEYCTRPLHAKVAAIDDQWATVGSSNLDPLSLALNLEANVIIRDREFNAELRTQLDRLLREQCRRVDHRNFRGGSLWHSLRNFVAYHCTRHFPRWAGWLPAHLPHLHSVEPKPQFAETK